MMTTEDSLDEALTISLVQHFQNNINSYLGRTAIQKLSYFAKVLGVPLNYPFRIYYYGPYSDDLASASDRLLASGALKDASPDPYRYSNLMVGAEGTRILSKHAGALREYEPTIKSVVEAFGDLDPTTLELLSTLHFVSQRLKAEGKQPGREDVWREFRGVKGDKFTDEQFERAYGAMATVGLVA